MLLRQKICDTDRDDTDDKAGCTDVPSYVFFWVGTPSVFPIKATQS